MVEQVKRINAPIGRVRCRATSCKYYGQGDLCMAQIIEVKPIDTSKSTGPKCATFVEN